ncbi:monooxygenase 2-like [Cryptomeria japonica]|uniref:monooxygenase 2-like n=1 Tax=Cryptomeria japonica TaxID=3369 RepID=UPI0027DA57F5|nr:monooxygenase 2-like [Cryptomeria japonica]
MLSTTSGLTKSIDLQDHDVRSVLCKELLQTLAQALLTNTIRFGSKISAIHQRGFVNEAKFEVNIGCDRVNSTVAKWLGFGSSKLAGRSTFLGLGCFPQGHHFELMMVQIWGDGLRAGFAPCNERDVFWFFNRKSLPRGKY